MTFFYRCVYSRDPKIYGKTEVLCGLDLKSQRKGCRLRKERHNIIE